MFDLWITDLHFVPVYFDVLISVRTALFVMYSHQMKHLVEDNTLGEPDLLCPVEINGMSPRPWAIVSQSGKEASPLVADLHPVPISGGGGSELDAGDPFDILHGQGYAASLLRIKVAAEMIVLLSQTRSEEVDHLRR